MNKFDYEGLKQVVALGSTVVSGDGITTSTVIIDTIGFESITFGAIASAYTAGTLTISQVEEGDDPALSDASIVPSERIPAGTSATALNEVAERGAVLTKRYCRVSIEGADSADFTALVTAVLSHANSQDIRS